MNCIKCDHRLHDCDGEGILVRCDPCNTLYDTDVDVDSGEVYVVEYQEPTRKINKLLSNTL